MKKADLPQNAQDLLASFQLPSTEAREHAVPLYFRDGDTMTLVEDIALKPEDNPRFEREGYKSGLYRGGAIVFVKTAYGYLVVPDERFGWLKPAAAGIAEFHEAHDLREAGRRELLEELFVFSLNQNTRYVPHTARREVNRVHPFGFSVRNVREHGKLVHREDFINEQCSTYEAILEWDISDLENYSITCHEEWYRGGHSGITVYVVKEGKVVGNFSGQQGFIPFNDYIHHPTLERFLTEK